MPVKRRAPDTTKSKAASDGRDTIRLSLRLFSSSRMLERRLDTLMRSKFGATLSRFDFLSAIDRHGSLALGEVSQKLLVSNGNVTGLAARLKQSGLIETVVSKADRRIQHVRLTARGKSTFKRMARAHSACVGDLLAEMSATDRRHLVQLLDCVKASIRLAAKRQAAP